MDNNIKAMTLQRLCAINIAASLWEANVIKAELKRPFCGVIARKEGLPCSDCWTMVVEKVLQNAKSLPLVMTSMGDVEKNVIILGDRKLFFIKHVLAKLHFDIKFSERMFWTYSGVIDEGKIICEFWLKEFEQHIYHFRSNRPNEMRSMPMWFWACAFAQENIIIENQTAIANFINRYYDVNVDDYVDMTYRLISLMLLINYKYEVRSQYLQDFILMIDGYFEVGDYTIKPEVMLELSAYKGFFDAVKYYWNKLKENEQVFCAINIPPLLIQICDRLLKNESISHRLIKIVEVLTFLLNKMPKENRQSFTQLNINILLQINANTWPYQEISFFELEWFDWDKVEFKELAINMYNCLEGKVYTHVMFKGLYIDFLREILGKIPKSEKIELFVQNKIASDFCFAFGVSWMKLLFSDGDVKEFRDQIIITGSELYRRLFWKMEYGLLINLFNTFISDNSRKCFLKVINLEFVVKHYSGYSASAYFTDKVLDWLFTNEAHKLLPDKKHEAVSQIFSENGAELCFEFTRHQKYDLAHKFLKWQFNSEEAEKSLKESILSNHKDIIKGIYYIWSKSYRKNGVQLATLKCSEFLIFYLGSEEEAIKYKKEKLNIFIFENILENERFIKKIYRDVGNLCWEAVDVFNDLLVFLSVPNEKIIEVKGNMRSNIQLWIHRCVRGKHDLGLATFLINWLYHEDDEKEMLVKYYIDSDEGNSVLRDVMKKELSLLGIREACYSEKGGFSVGKLFKKKLDSLQNQSFFL